MKTKPVTSVLEISMLIFLLMGCTRLVSAPQTINTPAAWPATATIILATQSSSPEPTVEKLTPTLKITTTSIQKPTPIPTASVLSSEKESDLLDALQSIECILPCYLGITPGKTNITEAQAILEGLGGSMHEPYIRKDGAKEYSFDLSIGDPLLQVDAINSKGRMAKIDHSLRLIVDHNVVQVIEADIVTRTSKVKLQKYWSRYSAREIFLQRGSPDQIYTDTSKDLESQANLSPYFMFLYQKIGIRIEITGIKNGESICPQPDGDYIHISFDLYNINSKLSIDKATPSDRDVWAVVDEVLKVNKTEFYHKVLSDPKACFEPRIVQ